MNALAVKIRKPKLGTLKYKQVEEKWTLTSISTLTPKELLEKFDFAYYTDNYNYESTITTASIGKSGLTGVVQTSLNITSLTSLVSFEEFIYQISNNLYGVANECDLLIEYREELKKIYFTLQNNNEWIDKNPYISIDEIIENISSCFVDEEYYTKEHITSDVEIELLEWNNIENIKIDITNNDLMPPIEKKDIRTYLRTPAFYEEDSFEKNNIDPQDISFNYIPYRMDSQFEVNALVSMLKQKEFDHLEIYYNGYKDSELQKFFIKTPYGSYTPDFLILKRYDNITYKAQETTQSSIEKILIIETKGKPYYEGFKLKEQFIKDVFLKHNPNFTFTCIVDEKRDNDFDKHISKIKAIIRIYS